MVKSSLRSVEGKNERGTIPDGKGRDEPSPPTRTPDIRDRKERPAEEQLQPVTLGGRRLDYGPPLSTL